MLLAVAAALGLCCAGTGALVLLGAVSGDGLPSPGGNAPTGDGPLLGSWVNGSASPTSYRNLVTGDFAPPSGTGVLYDFNGDGTCAYSAMLQSTVYSCTSWLFVATDECTWSFDGAVVTIEHVAGVTRSRMCGGEVKEGVLKPNTHHYRVQRTDEGTQRRLVLTEDGVDLHFLGAN